MKRRELLPLECRGLYEVCESSQDVEDYAERLEKALEAAEEEFMSQEPVMFTYRNWKGEVSERTVIPIKLWTGCTEFHTDTQLLLTAFDTDKQAERTFAVADIIHKHLVPSMNRDEFKTFMLNTRTAGRLIDHENLEGEAWLDRLFDTLKQVYYLNELERPNNMDTESGN